MAVSLHSGLSLASGSVDAFFMSLAHQCAEERMFRCDNETVTNLRCSSWMSQVELEFG